MNLQKECYTNKVENEIESLDEFDFKNISQKTESFGIAIGEYFSEFGDLLNLCGMSSNYNPPISIPSDLNITHNDYHSEKLYKRIVSQANVNEINIAPVLFFIITQVNIAYRLLPRLLKLDSNLLLRIQFLTAYHALSSLLKIQNKLDHEFANLLSFENILTTVPNIYKVRNVLAHYGLGEGKKYATENSNPLDEVIKRLSGISKNDLAQVTNNQLYKIYTWSNNRFSRACFHNIRALFGDHT